MGSNNKPNARFAKKSRLTVGQILAWADEYHRRTGEWPKENSGTADARTGETWKGVADAIERGLRGLPGGNTLPKLLARHRGARNIQGLPPLSVKQILGWADAYYDRTGRWPRHGGETIPNTGGETWDSVNHALMNGRRGLPGGGSLADLLAEHRGVRNTGNLPPLTVRQVLEWADEHRKRTGRWPGSRTPGVIPGSFGETWRSVDTALEHGSRGLPGPSSLARFLAEHRGVRNIQGLPPLTLEQILAWADAHFRRYKRWPSQGSGLIPKSGGETWRGVDTALRMGYRGLPGRSSLSNALDKHRAIAEARIRMLG
jgi:phage-related protein